MGENARSSTIKWNEIGDGHEFDQDGIRKPREFASPKQLMIAREFYRRATGEQMDKKNKTMCPKFEAVGSDESRGTPVLYFDSDRDRVHLYSCFGGVDYSDIGVRRVVSKEL